MEYVGENWKPKSLKRTQDVSSTAKSLKYFQVDDYGKIKIPEYENLPILDHKDEILSKLENTQVLIITGETGSGKSTQVPQYILGIGSFTSDPSYKLELFQLNDFYLLKKLNILNTVEPNFNILIESSECECLLFIIEIYY